MSIEEAIKNLEIMLDSAQRRTRRNIVIPDLIEAIEMAIEALKERSKPYITIKVDKDMIDRVINETIDNLYYECENCGQRMIPQRKEENE